MNFYEIIILIFTIIAVISGAKVLYGQKGDQMPCIGCGACIATGKCVMRRNMDKKTLKINANQKNEQEYHGKV